MKGQIRIGCSGWHYPHWRGRFYPEAQTPQEWFHFYATCFDTVELNTTFYHLPALQALVKRTAGPRLKKISWSSTLFPSVPWKCRGPIPFGDVIGLAAVFSGPQEKVCLARPAAVQASARSYA